VFALIETVTNFTAGLKLLLRQQEKPDWFFNMRLDGEKNWR